MTKNKAGFRLRLLASITDALILLLPHSLFWLYLSSSRDVTDLGTKLALYLVAWLLPSTALGFLYSSLLTYYFGGTFGKLLTGLRVVGEKGQLSLKRIIFRQTVGYGFSFTLFGLGYLSVIKDKNKQAWHDKAVGSQVVIASNLWPLGLLTLLLLVFINVFLVVKAINNVTRSPIFPQLSQTFESLDKERLTPTPTSTPSLSNPF